MGLSPTIPLRALLNDDDRIQLRVTELGLDKVGPFVAQPQATPDGRGTYRKTAKGAIFQSDLYGSVFVAEPVMAVWASPAVAQSPQLNEGIIAIGPTVQVTLGLPVKATTAVGDAAIGWFENGLIVARAGGGFAVYGPIYIHYMKLGGPGGWAGLPTSTVLRASGQPGPQGQAQFGGGTVCRFANCDIYWSKPTRAAEVHGLIRQRYNALGGPASDLGYPTTNELPVHAPAGLFSNASIVIGRVNRFERGSIYWSSATGAWEVDQWMLPTYARQEGGPAGGLGFPVGPSRKSPGGTRWYQNYARGVLHRPIDGTDVTKVSKLDLRLIRFETKGDDTVTGNAQDLYVTLTATTSDGQSWKQRYPENATCYGDSVTIDRVVHSFTVLDGGMVLDLTFDAWDDDDWPDRDDRLGTVQARHTIDNGWEVTTRDTEWHGDFRVKYNLDPGLPYDESKVRQQLFWQFPNLAVPELTYENMAETFSDVQQEESWLLNPFNALFYETVYKSFGQNGLCFGLSLEAARAHQGQSISNEPINRYPCDPIRINEAIVHHGYQLGGDQIDHFVEEYVLGHTRDPVRAFERSRAAYAAGDFPILSVSNDGLYSKGHAVMPYRWDTKDPHRWVMFICNPNHALPPGSDTANDDKPGNIIEILEPRSGNPTFRYAHTKEDIWSGGTSSGGRMLAIPLHILQGEPRTPFWEVLIAAIGATVILCADGGRTETVSIAPRPIGRPPLVPGDLPPGVTPVPFHDVPGRALQMLRVDRTAFADARAQSLAHAIRSNGSYAWGMRGPGITAVVRAKGSAGVDTVSVLGRELRKPAELVVATGRDGGTRALSVDLAGHGLGGANRRFRVDQVALAPGRSFNASLESGGEELILRGSGGEPMTVRVAAQRQSGTLAPRDIRIDPDQTVRLRPTDWNTQSLPAAKLDVQVLDRSGGLVSRRTL